MKLDNNSALGEIANCSTQGVFSAQCPFTDSGESITVREGSHDIQHELAKETQTLHRSFAVHMIQGLREPESKGRRTDETPRTNLK
jgi:hypothetical protein